MRYRKLGRTDMEVSVVAMGCWALVSDFTWGQQDQADSIAAIRAAVDSGVNLFDTAEGYGRGASEELLGRTVADVRKDVIIATKVSGRSLAAGKVKEACEGSLRRLKTDRIDIYQIHWPSQETPIAETLGALEELKAEGKVRQIGVSNFGPDCLKELLGVGRVESNQLCYSLLWRPIEHGIQPICAAEDISILCYSPLCQGLLTGKFTSADQVPATRARARLFSKDRPHCRHQEPGCEEDLFDAVATIRKTCEDLNESMTHVSLAWLLAQDAVTSVIAGARNAAQAAQNAAAASLELPGEAIKKLSAATDSIKAYAGTNADLWESQSRMDRRQAPADGKGAE